MIKAELDLNNVKFREYSHLDLEKNWRSVTVIRIWLKARNFDLNLPIFVTRIEEKNILTFFQTKTDPGKHIVIVHPNPQILNQLDTVLKAAGYSVFGFRKVKDANQRLTKLFETNTPI